MRFTQVFYLLLTISAITAFVLPSRLTARAKPAVETLLTPIAQPSRSLTGWVSGRSGGGPTTPDTRPAATIVSENLELKQSIAKLTYDLAELRKISAEQDKLGDIRDLCTPFTVLGTDVSGVRQMLSLRGGSFSGLTDKMIVLYDRDVVGILVDVGAGGAKVRLVTDPASGVEGHFATFKRDPAAQATTDGQPGMQFVRLDLPVKLIEGGGNGVMKCRNIAMDAVQKAGLTVGAWVVVDDRSWPTEVQGRRLGVVSKIIPDQKMMAAIEISPATDLLRLSKVMVLTKSR
jgi:hypothetical protein